MDYKLVTRHEDLGSIANEVLGAAYCALDLETTALRPWLGKPRLCSINTGNGVKVVDLFQTQGLGPVVDALSKTNAVVIGQNLKFDQQWLLHHYGLELSKIFDTFRASTLIHNGKRIGHGLWDLYSRELGIVSDAQDLGGSDWSGSLTPEQLFYSADDVHWLPALREKLKPQLAANGLNKTALIEFQVILAEAALENTGFRLDSEMWLNLYERNNIQRAALEAELLYRLPHPEGQLGLFSEGANWNLSSTQQLMKSLARLGIELESTDEDSLAAAASRDPVLLQVIAHRKVSKLCSSFGPDYLGNIDAITGRVHASFYPFTGAGRYSCSKPNLQQIPRLKDFRKCFRPLPGKKLIIADYSQVELRIAAQISGDEKMIQAYNQGQDLHKLTAAWTNEVSVADVTSEMRQLSKAINFGLCIAAGQRVLTHVGLISIENIEDWHLLWDGVEWVRHRGLIFKGIKKVITFDGLTATPDHEVYTNDGRKIRFGKLASSLHFGRIAVGGVGEVAVGYTEFDRQLALIPGESEIDNLLSEQPEQGLLAPVYDILDAGPRHRFTVEGKVVSNCYGMGAEQLVIYALSSYGVVMTLNQARQFRAKYFKAYDGINAWHQKTFRQIKPKGVVRTLSGRLRYLEAKAHNEYLNSPVQGTGADGLKRALRILYDRLKCYGGRARVVHMVHDEIAIEADDEPEFLVQVRADLERSMIEGMSEFITKVPIVVDSGVGCSWAEKG